MKFFNAAVCLFTTCSERKVFVQLAARKVTEILIPYGKLKTFLQKMADIFAALDESFVNIEKNNQPYVWQCKNYLVTSFFEVPVPTPPGSTVRYSKSHLISIIYKLEGIS